MSNSDRVLFVQGIPIDLDRQGLANLFNRAGPIKNARLIPPKNSSYTSTFGFVEFSSRTTAATALQMFNNYKLGSKYLNVSYAQQKASQDTALSRNSVCSSNGRAVSRLSNHDLNQSSDSDKLSRKSSIGRGSIIHQSKHRYQRGNYDLSRPFARKVLSRQNSKISSAEARFGDAEEAHTQAKPLEELKIGELYPVYITHVNTPSNFFVHLITAKEKTGNLINNMDNYYRNGLHQENADLDKRNLKLEIDDMCAGYLDSFWYRARVIDKSPEKQTYRLSIIDFGDVHELPFDHVTHLSQEFCETKPASIRCKLAEIRPPRGNSEWSQKALDTMDTLFKQEDALFAKILSIDEFEPCSGRFETIYGIDLIYGGEESIISYFIQNALAIKENDFTPITNNNFVKLNAGHAYKVNIQYFDESYESPYFFVCLSDNFAKLEQLDGELQKISSDNTKFRYVEDMNELKMNDTLEALFETDSKWYRVEVRGLKPLHIYFLDFGNSEKIAQLVPKTLRYRLKFDSDNEIDLFNLDYQAIRCRYESNTENQVSEFLEKISQIDDFEAGFELTVIESNPGDAQQQDSYLVTLDNKKDLKQEQNIQQEKQEEKPEEKQEEKREDGIQLETGSVIDEVSFVHIESISEFYVQTQDTLRLFIDFQAKIQRLLELMLSNKSSQENKQDLFKKGDFVFGKFLSDMNWYRAVIINIEENSGQKSCDLSHLANDGRLYDVYFLDYGNKQENLPSSLLYSFDSVKQLNKNLNLMPMSELNGIVEMPFQAICCQLVQKKNNTRNNEVLKSLLLECLNFSIKIADTSKQKILDNLEIDKYLVYLSTDGKCLQDQFEDEAKVEKSLITPNGVYECKLSNLDKDIHVNLIDQVDEFLKLESLLTSDEKIGPKWRADATPNLADLVLARYVLDEQTSAWCRAKIIKKVNNVYDVFFIDYGNESLDLSVEDLAPLGAEYSLAKYPAFAHKIRLNKIEINVDKHAEYLSEFLSENFKIKVLSVEQEEELCCCCCLVVELWNADMSKCLNAEIGDESFSDKIEHTNVQHLYLANKTTELKVNVNYAFMDDLLKPFYFCLSDDLALRSQLDHELNQFYATNELEPSDFTLNAYIAVHSDNSWYRAQIKQILDTNSIFVFYIDYGFDELIQLSEQNKKQKLRKLDAKFSKYPRFVFGAALLNPMAAKADSYELIHFQSNDNQTLRQTLEDYFTASNSEQFDLVILSKLSSSCLNENFVPNEDYYGIEMYNESNMCLNEMIVASKEKKAKKPPSIRLTIDQIARQKPLNDQYCVFARAPDHFYVYNEERVLQVQVKTQQTCAKIVEQLEEYERQEEEKMQVDDLVYAKYDDDETWYRCRVTNYDEQSAKYELFYLDFGNIEIVSGSDVLTGWSEQHLEAFVSYEPQAYKCRLYGLANKEYSLEEKNKFKQFTSDKVFDVSFIKVDADGVNEVGLEIADKPEGNVHRFCIDQGIAGFKSFDNILKSERTSEENKFYINLLNGF